ncbi:MAG: hypothetical protein QXW77_00320 [Candidatus Hadarchaeales archaeon]
MGSLAEQLAFLFSPILVGVLVRRLGLRSLFWFLGVLTTWVILPLLAFVYVGGLTPRDIVTFSGAMVLAVVGVAACFFAVLPLTFSLSKEEGAAMVLNSSFMNVAHLGLPVVYAKLGFEYMAPAVLYSVTVAVLNLFLGTLLMHLLISRTPSLRHIFAQTFTFPAVALLLLALLLVYLHAPLPQDFRGFFSKWISPCFLLILLLQVGYHLRIEASRKYAKHVPAVGLARFVLCPLVTVATCHLLGLKSELLTRPALYLSMMPPAFFNLILAQSLGLDPRPYSLVLFSLTLLSFPLFLLL